ncbi:MAG: hypothetical protein Q7T54_06375 [Candidatus Levybacteria bacterium]|nr:hypothetical protein [Candidatus Levybacteria bacterium]
MVHRKSCATSIPVTSGVSLTPSPGLTRDTRQMEVEMRTIMLTIQTAHPKKDLPILVSRLLRKGWNVSGPMFTQIEEGSSDTYSFQFIKRKRKKRKKK